MTIRVVAIANSIASVRAVRARSRGQAASVNRLRAAMPPSVASVTARKSSEATLTRQAFL
ncbi:hypothetical protein HK102_010048, partial [Quaeritorhiza haematococci]